MLPSNARHECPHKVKKKIPDTLKKSLTFTKAFDKRESTKGIKDALPVKMTFPRMVAVGEKKIGKKT